MSYVLSPRSTTNLEGVHPDLVAVVKRALELSAVDFTVLEGVRTQERQDELWAQGRTKPGAVVTWIQTVGAHGVQPDGWGHAVDIAPFPIDWSNLYRFDQVAQAMFAAAKELDVELRWGADWDRDGNPRERGETDSPHFELWRG